MVEWETVEVVEGIAEMLAYLRSSGRQIVLATSAAISDEGQIRGALARGGLDAYFSHIYCFKNTDLPKGEEFYRYALNDLHISASHACFRLLHRAINCYLIVLYPLLELGARIFRQ